MLLVLLLASLIQDLPNGPGKEELLKVCRDCHELDTVIQDNRTRDGWKKTMAKMADRGAEGTDEQFEAIVNYLTKNFGKTNVNTATAAEITSTLDFSDKDTDLIIQHRPYKDWRDLTKVEGLDPAKVEAKKNHIAVQ